MECLVETARVPVVQGVRVLAVERGGGDSGSDTSTNSIMLNVPTGAEGAGAAAQSLTTAAYAPPTTNTTPSSDTTITSPPPHTTDQAQFEADKRAVYKHPLFPLLALLFERCELATQSSDTQSSDAFNLDIQAFVQHQERDRKPFLANEPEIDGLMIKAIQVLRIHLLELEKVQELCKDFCNRYITCLKGKMQSENLLRSDYTQGPGVISGLESNNNNMLHGNSESGSDSNSPIQYTISPTQQGGVHPPGVSDCMEPRTGVLAVDNSGGDPLIHHPTTPSTNTSHSPINNINNNSNNTSHSHTSSVNSSVASVLPSQTTPSTYHPSIYGALSGVPGISPTGYDPHIVHGSTPLGQIGVNVCPAPLDPTGMSGQLSPAPTTPGGSADDCDSDFTGRIGGSKKQKRGVLPKHATSVMRSWLFQHLVHPYPTEDEKRHIAAQTNLTLLQVNNWFINARRRILQPMLDAGAPNSDGGALPSQKSSSQRKKSHGGSNRRFWPQDIASLQPQLNSGVLSSSDEDECDSYSSDGEEVGVASGLVIDSAERGGGSGLESVGGGTNGLHLSNTDTRNSYSPDSDHP